MRETPLPDERLVKVAEAAMARELRDRYADMADVVSDLRRIQQGEEPVGARGVAEAALQCPAPYWMAAGAFLCLLVAWMVWPKQPPKPSVANDRGTNAAIAPPSGDALAVFAGAPGELGSADGPAATARFRAPEGIAVDSAGDLFLADARQQHHPQNRARRDREHTRRIGRCAWKS